MNISIRPSSKSLKKKKETDTPALPPSAVTATQPALPPGTATSSSSSAVPDITSFIDTSFQPPVRPPTPVPSEADHAHRDNAGSFLSGLPYCLFASDLRDLIPWAHKFYDAQTYHHVDDRTEHTGHTTTAQSHHQRDNSSGHVDDTSKGHLSHRTDASTEHIGDTSTSTAAQSKKRKVPPRVMSTSASSSSSSYSPFVINLVDSDDDSGLKNDSHNSKKAALPLKNFKIETKSTSNDSENDDVVEVTWDGKLKRERGGEGEGEGERSEKVIGGGMSRRKSVVIADTLEGSEFLTADKEDNEKGEKETGAVAAIREIALTTFEIALLTKLISVYGVKDTGVLASLLGKSTQFNPYQ